MEDNIDDLGLGLGTMSQQMHAPASEPLNQNNRTASEGKRSKILNDPIHNTIRLGPLAVKIMDSPQFQRLRDLKQLGLTYFVFQGASHNRFEHSIGVAHLAYKFAFHYMQGQPELGLTYHDLSLIEIAGLCHDLGHGPFSHVFENGFIKQEGIENWSHEDMSVKIFDCIVADKGMLGTDLTQEDVDRVKDMILASHKGAARERTGRQFLHEIVANGRNGLDVDKFDYLARDAHNCGMKVSIDIDRLMMYSMVVDGEICFKRMAHENVYDVYTARATMHRRCYGHRKGKAIDLMVVDILRAANPVLKITEMVFDPRKFVQLDDSILKRIEFYDVSQLQGEEKASMEKAKAILLRLRNRDLYKYCGDWVIPCAMVESGWKEPTPEQVFAHLPPLSGVAQEDIMLLTLSIDHTAGTRNPLQAVRFFDKWEDNSAQHLDPRRMSGFNYECYKECSVRVYCKKSDPESESAVKEAADKFLKANYGNIECSTPVRKVLKADDRHDNSEDRERNPKRKRQLWPVSELEETPPQAKAIKA